MKRTLVIICILFFCGLCLFALPSISSIISQAQENMVYVNDVPVFQIKTSKDGYTPVQRAAFIVKTLKKRKSSDHVKASCSREGGSILLNDTVIVRVTLAEARAHGKSIELLTRAWAQKLKSALLLSGLVLEKDSVQLEKGAQAFLKFEGVASKECSILNPKKDILSVKLANGGLVLQGLERGHVILTLQHSGGLKKIEVDVLGVLPKLPKVLTAQVCGDFCDSQLVAGAAKGQLIRNLELSEHAKLEVEPIQAKSVSGGGKVGVNVRAKIVAPEETISEGKVYVEVANCGNLRKKEKVLWYCNHPEEVSSYGVLSAANLKADLPMRILYHHTSAFKENMILQIHIKNLSKKPSRVMVFSGDGKQNRDPVRVGLDAGHKFVKSWLTGSGEIIEVPAGKSVPLSIRKLSPRETMSGLTYLRLLAGGAKELQIVAESVRLSTFPKVWWKAVGNDTPWREVTPKLIKQLDQKQHPESKHLYPKPFKTLSANYNIGGRFAFIRIGQDPILRQDKVRQLDGNFGVLYQIDAEIRNTTSKRAEAELVFEASAGYSGALFIIDGKYHSSPLLQTKQEYPIKKIQVEPGEKKKIQLMTMPLSGSSYPATIAIRPSGH